MQWERQLENLRRAKAPQLVVSATTRDLRESFRRSCPIRVSSTLDALTAREFKTLSRMSPVKLAKRNLKRSYFGRMAAKEEKATLQYAEQIEFLRKCKHPEKIERVLQSIFK